MGKILGVLVVLFIAATAYVYLFGAPDTSAVQTDDPQKLVDAGAQVGSTAGKVVDPWWEWALKQPWFYAAVGSGLAAIALRRIWTGMSPSARVAAAVVGTVIVVLVLVGMAA